MVTVFLILVIFKYTYKFQFVELNKPTPTDYLSGLLFLLCGANISQRTVEDAGPYKEKSNFFMRSHPYTVSFLLLAQAGEKRCASCR